MWLQCKETVSMYCNRENELLLTEDCRLAQFYFSSVKVVVSNKNCYGNCVCVCVLHATPPSCWSVLPCVHYPSLPAAEDIDLLFCFCFFYGKASTSPTLGGVMSLFSVVCTQIWSRLSIAVFFIFYFKLLFVWKINRISSCFFWVISCPAGRHGSRHARKTDQTLKRSLVRRFESGVSDTIC